MKSKISNVEVGVDFNVDDSLEKTVKKSVDSCEKEIQGMQDALDGITFKGFEPREDRVEVPQTKQEDREKPVGGGLSAMAQGLGEAETQVEEVVEKAMEIPEVFEAALDPAELLRQKQENIEMQIASTTEKLRTMNAEYAKMASKGDYGADFDKLGESITKAESKLISLQESLNSAAKKLKKMESAADEEGSGGPEQSDAVKKLEKRVAELERKLKGKDGKNGKGDNFKPKKEKSPKKEFGSIKMESAADEESGGGAAQSDAVRKLENQIADLEKKLKGEGKKKEKSDSSKPKKEKSPKKEFGGIKNLVKTVIGAAGIYKVFDKIADGAKKVIDIAIQGNLELRNSFKALQGNLQVAMQPIIDTITPMIESLIAKLNGMAKAFAEFVAKVFGTTYDQAKANAKKLETTAKSAQNSLLSIDELNVKSNEGSNLDYLDSANYDMSWADAASEKLEKIQEFFTGAKNWVIGNFGADFEKWAGVAEKAVSGMFKTVKKVFGDIKSLGPSLGKWFQEDLPQLISTGLQVSADVFGGLFETVNQVFNDIWDIAIFPIAEKLIGEFLPMITELATLLLETFGVLFEEVKGLFDSVWAEGIVPALSLFSDIFCDVIDIITAKWDEFGAPIFEGIQTAIQKTSEVLKSVWDTVLSPIWNNLISALREIWEEHLKPLVDKIATFVAKLVECALTIYNNFIVPIVKWFVENLLPPIVSVINRIVNAVKWVFGAICDIASPIIDFFSGILDFFTNIFSGNWEEAWESIVGAFASLWEGIVTAVKSVVNAIITVINLLIGGIYDVVVGAINMLLGAAETVGSWFGKDWNLKLPTEAPQIPYLAKGGIVNQPTLAMVGEAGKEAVVPLERNTEWMEAMAAVFVRALRTVMPQGETQSYDDEEIPFVIDGDTVIGWIRKEALRYKRQTGEPLFE